MRTTNLWMVSLVAVVVIAGATWAVAEDKTPKTTPAPPQLATPTHAQPVPQTPTHAQSVPQTPKLTPTPAQPVQQATATTTDAVDCCGVTYTADPCCNPCYDPCYTPVYYRYSCWRGCYVPTYRYYAPYYYGYGRPWFARPAWYW